MKILNQKGKMAFWVFLMFFALLLAGELTYKIGAQTNTSSTGGVQAVTNPKGNCTPGIPCKGSPTPLIVLPIGGSSAGQTAIAQVYGDYSAFPATTTPTWAPNAVTSNAAPSLTPTVGTNSVYDPINNKLWNASFALLTFTPTITSTPNATPANQPAVNVYPLGPQPTQVAISANAQVAEATQVITGINVSNPATPNITQAPIPVMATQVAIMQATVGTGASAQVAYATVIPTLSVNVKEQALETPAWQATPLGSYASGAGQTVINLQMSPTPGSAAGWSLPRYQGSSTVLATGSAGPLMPLVDLNSRQVFIPWAPAGSWTTATAPISTATTVNLIATATDIVLQGCSVWSTSASLTAGSFNFALIKGASTTLWGGALDTITAGTSAYVPYMSESYPINAGAGPVSFAISAAVTSVFCSCSYEFGN